MAVYVRLIPGAGRLLAPRLIRGTCGLTMPALLGFCLPVQLALVRSLLAHVGYAIAVVGLTFALVGEVIALVG